ncbi:hypothetical protein WSM22_42180 [Cytophagales bacterium WSM2-2]|nr:hypothetical protein WSM22_42180 [Cytophagales bacterium WSM2-2]
MKKLIAFVFLAVLTVVSYGQSFEGTVTWSSKTDPPDASGRAATGITLKAKGTTIIAVVNGGMMNGMEMWFMDNNKKITRLMRPQKMFAPVPAEAIAANEKATETSPFVKTAETVKILNYNCTKYTGEIKSRGVVTKLTYWTTTEIKDDQKVLEHQPDPFGSPKLPPGVEGVPMKIEAVASIGKVIHEVTEIKSGKFSDDEFKIPADFKEVGK